MSIAAGWDLLRLLPMHDLPLPKWSFSVLDLQSQKLVRQDTQKCSMNKILMRESNRAWDRGKNGHRIEHYLIVLGKGKRKREQGSVPTICDTTHLVV